MKSEKVMKFGNVENNCRFICRVFAVVIMGIFLSGCGIMPMWASISHTIGDAVLSLSTGKSSGEHGLSFITGRDCQFIRVIDGQDICMTEKAYVDYLISLDCEIYTWNILNRVSCKKSSPPPKTSAGSLHLTGKKGNLDGKHILSELRT